MNLPSLLRFTLGMSLAMAVYAQQRGPAPGGGGGIPTNPGSPTGPSRGNVPTFPGSQPDSIGSIAPDRPMFLTGKVMMEDGTPPPDSVGIQIVCRATPRTIAYTDRKGNFSVDLTDRNTAFIADASDPSADFGVPTTRNTSGQRTICPGEPGLMGTSVQADLAGFRSDVITLGTRRSLDDPNVGTLILHRLGNVEGLTISATSGLAPKDAQKALEKGRAAEAKQKWPDAEKELQKAVAIYPKYAAAWLELGNVQQRQKNVDGARSSYAQALAADSKFVPPYLQLASMAATEQKWQEVVDDTDHLLHLNPINFPQAWMFNALANYYLGKKDEAEKSAREGISHDPAHRYPRMNYLLGVLLSQKQDFAASAENIRAYLKYAPNAADAGEIRKQLAEIEKAAGPQVEKAATPEAERASTPQPQHQ
ncbi:MAG TPA: tetratricopeptide repeat protein [Bryobacteraceae bacterium]|nr:tetratricopeptide repeat protein [Bryobacteraceae bacterium]